MSRKLKLYVWQNVLTDYTDGMIVAYAANIKAARDQVYIADPTAYPECLDSEPTVYEEPIAFTVWGGG